MNYFVFCSGPDKNFFGIPLPSFLHQQPTSPGIIRGVLLFNNDDAAAAASRVLVDALAKDANSSQRAG